MGCKSYGFSSACGFFMWHDPPMSPRAKVVMNGLLKKIRQSDSQRRRERVIWILLLTLCLIFSFFK
ncbi:hypothetical protein PTKIN_Ptkin09bG0085500 [Pterospermum kingtungense]